MKTLRLDITGMRSIYCAQTLQAALNGIPGVSAYVSYKKGIAEVQLPSDLPRETLEEAVRGVGFEVAASRVAHVPPP